MRVPKNMSGVGIIPNFGAIGFPDMTWVSAATYSGVEPIGGHPCLVFKKDDMTAWIDQESRYPVQWQRGGELRTFRQLARPAGTLEPPPEVVKLIQANKRRLQIINTPPPKGG
jgi:hypothetical protein